MENISERRQIEKRLMAVAKQNIWSKENLDWLSRENALRFNDYVTTCFELMNFYYQNAIHGDANYDITVISVDVLQDLLARLEILKDLMSDETLKEREDIKQIVSGWRPTYKNVHSILVNLFGALDHALRELMRLGNIALEKLEDTST